jgi:hypothetical protein
MKLFRIYLVIVLVLGITYVAFGLDTDVVSTTLDVAGQAPNITGVTLMNVNYTIPDEIVLEAANQSTITCFGYVYDLDGYGDLDAAVGEIWNTDMVNYGDATDKRHLYRNTSCNLTEVTGQPNINALANCTFGVWFYANYSQWNCTITVNDTLNKAVNGTDNASVLPLLAVEIVNSSIEWGTIALGTPYDTNLNVSMENEGNVHMDIQVDAYNSTAVGIPSASSFDCQLGRIPTDVIVINDTFGGVYADSTPLSNDTYVNVSDFNLLPQDGSVLDIPTNKSLYLGINIPESLVLNGTCNGFFRVDAVDGTP